MRIIKVSDGRAVAQQLRRTSIGMTESLAVQTRAVFDEVSSHGDAAVLNYTEKFDGVSLVSLRVSRGEIAEAYNKVTTSQISAIRLVKTKLAPSERALLDRLKGISISSGGVSIQRKIKPIDSVGCYIPGGKARYPSTLVMCAVPAKIAGVRRIVAISPPMKDKSIDPLTLVAADICGVDEFYKIGGAQGIAALALGTESIKSVSKIVGPGGMFVTAAKLAASSRASIDMVAGPTELVIYCDKRADPYLVAVDLVSQAEHGPDTICGIVTLSEEFAAAVSAKVSLISSSDLPRFDIIKQSLDQNGFAAICADFKCAVEFLNEFAPEHLEIMAKNPDFVAAKIESAGLVLVGLNSPSAASDYCLGSNHVLPTLGFARSRGSLSVLDFIKVINVVKVSKPALARVEPSIQALTQAEGFPNHYGAVRARLVNGSGKKKKKGQRKKH